MKLFAVECMTSAQHTHYLLNDKRAIRVFRNAEQAVDVARELDRAANGSAAYRVVSLEVEMGRDDPFSI